MFGYQILTIFFNSPRLLLGFVTIEKTYQTPETVFHRLSDTHLEFRENASLHVVFSTLFSVFGYPDETYSRNSAPTLASLADFRLTVNTTILK